jgi:hypothetical protein
MSWILKPKVQFQKLEDDMTPKKLSKKPKGKTNGSKGMYWPLSSPDEFNIILIVYFKTGIYESHNVIFF